MVSLLYRRRYGLAGQVQSPLSNGKALSVGLKYRVFDSDFGQRAGPVGEISSATAYTLAPSYQVQMSFQYSASGTLGLAVGRELETYTPYVDSGAGRQLTLTGQHWLTPTWALSYDLLTSDPTSPLRLQGLGLRLGMRYRF